MLLEFYSCFLLLTTKAIIKILSASVKILVTFLILMLLSFLFYPFGEKKLSSVYLSSKSKTNINTNEQSVTLIFDSVAGNIKASLSNESINGYEIYYTIDGSNPASNGVKYKNEININSKDCVIPTHTLYKTSPHARSFFTCVFAKQIRAVAINKSDKHITRESNYLIPDVKNDIPVVALNLEPESFFSYDNGIYVEGKEAAWSGRRGMKWWYWPGNFSLREKNSKDAFVQLNIKGGKCYKVKVKISGNATRAFPQKSLRLETDNVWDVVYDQNEIPGSFLCNSVLLKNAGNDWAKAFMRDPLSQILISEIKSLDYLPSKPVQLFVNGEFWGLHYLSARYNEFYFAEKYRIPDYEVRFVDFADWNQKVVRSQASDLVLLEECLNSNAVSNEVKLEKVKACVEVNSFLDFICAEVFFANYDWPLNNNKAFSIGNDGKWKWLLNDIDVGLGYYGAEKEANNNMFKKLDSLKSLTALVYQTLMSDKLIRKQFTERLKYLLSNDFHPNKTVPKLNALQKQIQPMMPQHISRWRSHQNSNEWLNQCNEIRTFLFKRHQYLQDYLKNETGII